MKYVAIFLVIWGHVVQQSLAPGVVPLKADGIYRFIYSFHMPLFMGISGYFLGKSILKIKDPLIYVREKLKKRVLGLVIPMLAFGFLKFIVNIGWGYHPSWLTIFHEAIGIWFLGVLLINTLIVLGVTFLCNGIFMHDWKYFLIGMIFTVISKMEYGFYYGPFMYVYFVSGYFIAIYITHDQICKSAHYWKTALLGFIVVYWIYNNLPWPLGGIGSGWYSSNPIHLLIIALLRLILGFWGSYLCLMLVSVILPYIRSLQIFREVSQAGRYTLDIYLLQILLVEMIWGPCYRRIVDRVGFNYIQQNGVLFEIVISFLVAVVFLHVIILISKLLNYSSVCSKLLFYRDRSHMFRGRNDI